MLDLPIDLLTAASRALDPGALALLATALVYAAWESFGPRARAARLDAGPAADSDAS
jgi:hypothetical protein